MSSDSYGKKLLPSVSAEAEVATLSPSQAAPHLRHRPGAGSGGDGGEDEEVDESTMVARQEGQVA